MISKNRIDNLLVRIVLLFPCAVLLQGLPGLEWINKCIIAVLMFLILWQMKDQRNVLVSFVLCGTLSIISLLLSNRAYLHIQDLFYFPLFVLYCMYWGNRSREFEVAIQKNLTFGAVWVLLWCLLVGISVLFPSSFEHLDNEVFFKSFSDGPFRLASSCVIIMLMLHILAYYSKWHFFLLQAVPMGTILATGARVYLLVGAGIFFLSLYLICKHKRMFWILLLPVLVAMIVAVLNSSIVDKFIVVKHSQRALYGNYLDAVTSGRTIFWRLELDAFRALPFWKRLVGNGISFAYEVTGTKYINSIWSHNDFIHMLMSYGELGLGLYLFAFYRLIAQFRKTYSMKRVPFLGAVGLCLGNAFINGLYTYSAAMLAMPFLFYAMSLNCGKGERKSVCVFRLLSRFSMWKVN